MSNQLDSASVPVVSQTSRSNRTCLKVVGGVFIFLAIVTAGAVYMVKQAIRATLKITETSVTRQIGVALLDYEQTYHSFPPPYTVDAAGNKLHSWRALLLPYLDERPLYDAIDFSKPWDAPENAKFHSISIPALGNPLVDIGPGETIFRVIVHPRGVFSDPTRTTSLADIKDPSSTILVVQSGSNQATHWMKPEDYSLSDFMAIDRSNSIYPKGGTLYSTCNASSREIFVQHLTSKQIEDMVFIKEPASNNQP